MYAASHTVYIHTAQHSAMCGTGSAAGTACTAFRAPLQKQAARKVTAVQLTGPGLRAEGHLVFGDARHTLCDHMQLIGMPARIVLARHERQLLHLWAMCVAALPIRVHGQAQNHGSGGRRMLPDEGTLARSSACSTAGLAQPQPDTDHRVAHTACLRARCELLPRQSAATEVRQVMQTVGGCKCAG